MERTRRPTFATIRTGTSTGDRSSTPLVGSPSVRWPSAPSSSRYGPVPPGPSSRRRRHTRAPPAFSIGSRPASRFRFRSMWGPWIWDSTVASAALAGGVDIVEMGTPLLKTQGVSNVVPAFRKQFPDALLLADMKTMDGGGGEARGVYAGGGNIVDFLALAGVDTAKSICAVRDEFRRAGPELPRLVFSDILVPHQGPAAQAGEVALRMVEAGVDAVGIHLQSDARRANPKLIEDDYLGDVARAVFERIDKRRPGAGGRRAQHRTGKEPRQGGPARLRDQRQYGPAGQQRPLQPATGRDPAPRRRFHRRGLGRLGRVAISVTGRRHWPVTILHGQFPVSGDAPTRRRSRPNDVAGRGNCDHWPSIRLFRRLL